MNRITGEIEGALKLIASNLPVVMEETVEYHLLKGSELKEMEIFKDDKGNDLIDEVEYRWPMPVQIAFNHYRRLKKAYMEGGEPAVMLYLDKIESCKVEA